MFKSFKELICIVIVYLPPPLLTLEILIDPSPKISSVIVSNVDVNIVLKMGNKDEYF
jgi:hypothetical protein